MIRRNVIKFLKKTEVYDDLNQLWTFEVGELEDHISRIDDGYVHLNYG